MSNLNLNILVQSVENLSQQVEKSEASAQQDKISLDKAQALLEGLKGMFGIQSITMENAGDFLSIVATINEHRAQFYMDPSKQLKLCGVKITDPAGIEIDSDQILQGSVLLEPPNDIRQAMFLVTEKIACGTR